MIKKPYDWKAIYNDLKKSRKRIKEFDDSAEREYLAKCCENHIIKTEVMRKLTTPNDVNEPDVNIEPIIDIIEENFKNKNMCLVKKSI